MKEKRKYPRYGIVSLAEVYFPQSGAQERAQERDRSENMIEAFINSISRGGIGIYSPDRIGEGEEVYVKISFLQTNGNEEVTEIIPGKVVWVKDFHKNFVIGIAFTTLDSLRHAKLLSYVEAAAQGSA